MLTVQQIKDTVADYFKDKPVKTVYLFGLCARGEAKEDSDVDLGVIVEETDEFVEVCGNGTRFRTSVK